MTKHILRIDASMRVAGSNSRKLAQQLIETISNEDTQLTHRDLKSGLPFVNEQWINANFTPTEQRSTEQQQVLGTSDLLIEELEVADTLVIAVPIYNFGVPAAFKAWIDMVARAKRTFEYSQNGPKGLLTGKKAYVVITSGGTKLGSEIDFVSSWITHVLSFIGITDSQIIDATGLMADQPQILAAANAQIGALI
jgi:FMN-dependent NADH-azoreductase